MSVPTKLSGGTLIRRDPQRLPVPHQAQEPFIRLEGTNLDLHLSSACMALFQRASAQVLGTPDTGWAEVAVREIDGQRYLLIVPTTGDNPHKVQVSRRPDKNGTDIRTADDVLISGGIVGAPGADYKMNAYLVEDAEFKWVVAANWTAAQEAK